MPPYQCFERGGVQVRWDGNAQDFVSCDAPATPPPTPPAQVTTAERTTDTPVAGTPNPQPTTVPVATAPTPVRAQVTTVQPTLPANQPQPLQPGPGEPGASTYTPPTGTETWLSGPWPWVLGLGFIANLSLAAYRRTLRQGNTSPSTPVDQRIGGANVDPRSPEQRAREQREIAVEHWLEDHRADFRSMPLEGRLSLRDFIVEQWNTDHTAREGVAEINRDFIRRMSESYDRLDPATRSEHVRGRREEAERRRRR